jgi:hypothetical protein
VEICEKQLAMTNVSEVYIKRGSKAVIVNKEEGMQLV